MGHMTVVGDGSENGGTSILLASLLFDVILSNYWDRELVEKD